MGQIETDRISTDIKYALTLDAGVSVLFIYILFTVPLSEMIKHILHSIDSYIYNW